MNATQCVTGNPEDCFDCTCGLHKPLDDAAIDAAFDQAMRERAAGMSDARLKAEIRRITPPGAQVPPVEVKHDPDSALEIDPTRQPASVVQSAVMDANGNVRMEFHMSPDDRRQAARAAQDMARQHASMLQSPTGLRGLFQTNKCRFIIKKRPSPPAVVEQAAPPLEGF